MRKIVPPLALVALVVLLSLGVSGCKRRDDQTLTAKPNIVFILADDMRKDDLKYMPQTRALLQDEGMSFENAFVSNALCCPSRATIMRGQYSHNTIWCGLTRILRSAVGKPISDMIMRKTTWPRACKPWAIVLASSDTVGLFNEGASKCILEPIFRVLMDTVSALFGMPEE
jgi:hypothetical protein